MQKKRMRGSLEATPRKHQKATSIIPLPPSVFARETPEREKVQAIETPEGSVNNDLSKLFRENTQLRGEVFRLKLENANLKLRIGGDA